MFRRSHCELPRGLDAKCGQSGECRIARAIRIIKPLVEFLDISATQYTAKPHRQAAHRSEFHRRGLPPAALSVALVALYKVRRHDWRNEITRRRIAQHGRFCRRPVNPSGAACTAPLAGQSGDGDRQSTTTAPAQALPAYAAPPPIFQQPRLCSKPHKTQSFCRSRLDIGLEDL